MFIYLCADIHLYFRYLHLNIIQNSINLLIICFISSLSFKLQAIFKIWHVLLIKISFSFFSSKSFSAISHLDNKLNSCISGISIVIVFNSLIIYYLLYPFFQLFLRILLCKHFFAFGCSDLILAILFCHLLSKKNLSILL